MSNTIESLEIEIIGSSQSAEKALDALEGSLRKIKTAVRGGCGLTAVTKQLTAMNIALGSMNPSSISNLKGLADGLNTLSGIGKFKLSSSVANQITNIGNATKSLDGADFSKLTDLANALTPLTTIGKANLGSAISQLGKLPAAIQPLSAIDMGGLSTKIRDLASAVAPLANVGKSNLGSTLNQIKKLPEAFTALGSVDMGAFSTKIRELTDALKPLADEMQKVANGFSAFPTKIQKLLNATNQIPKANSRVSISYVNLAAKIAMAYTAVKRTASMIASWINKSNEYIENLNLFTVAMGKYSDEAGQYAEKVGELMGIDPGEWMRNQGVFMTLATGFGVVSDRAYTMGQNLTQLGYDLSSFFNITFEDAMQKLQSGISGELEPLRRLGYDLSQARLEAIALSLGIDKAVSSMTQAEKAELRYYAILTQVTTAQGDMARTLDAPANQLRVLRAQVTQAARALGNIFIPALNAVLPYAIAVAKVIRLLASTIANLFGATLPKVDYSGLSNLSAGASDATDAIDETTGSVKKLKRSLMGFDELNILTGNSNSGGGGAGIGGGGGFDFELPTYDFLGDLTESRVGQIVGEMREWLGLTGEIKSWSDLLNTNFGQILVLVGEIGAGLLLWKLSSGLLTGLRALSDLKKAGLDIPLTIMAGTTLTLTGFTIEFTGVADAVKNGLDELNISEIILGGLTGTVGAGLLGKGIGVFIAKTFADSSIAAAITAGGGAISTGLIGATIGALMAGVPMFVVGIYDAIVNGFDWLNGVLIPIGSTLTGAGSGALIGILTGLVTGPIGTAIGAAVGLVIGLVTDLIVANWDEVCSFFSGVGGWFDTNVIKPVAKFFSDLWVGISTAASECWTAITVFFTPAIEWFGQLFGSVHQTISDVFYNIGVIASGCWEIVKAVWGIVADWFNERVVTPVVDFFSDLWNGFTTAASQAWEAVKEIFGTVADFFGDIFGEAWEKVVGVFSIAGDIFTDIKDGILTAFKAIVNGLIRGLNNTIAVPFNRINWVLDQIRNISILGLTPFTGLGRISVPEIPQLAEGAVLPANKPFLAMVGDQKHGTNVEAPLSTIQEAVAVVMEDMVDGMMAGFEALLEENRLLREVVEEKEFGDEAIYKSGVRYQQKLALAKGR